MQTYTRKQVYIRFAIGILVGAVLYSSSTLYVDTSSTLDIALSIAVCILQGFGLTFNVKKFIKGFIAPIPIISALIELVKAYYYALMGILVMVGIKKELTVGKKE